MRTIDRYGMWISLIVADLIAAAMMVYRPIADAGFMLLFVPLLWACFLARPRYLWLMALLVSLSRFGLEYIRLASREGPLDVTRLIVSPLSVVPLYLALVVGFLWYRRRERLLREQLVARERTQAMSQFIGGLAHDLNNILSVIMGTAHLLHADGESSDSAKADAQTITDAAQRGSTLIRRMLQQRPDRPHKEPTDLNSLAAEAIRYVKPALGPEVELNVEAGPDPLPVLANALEIYQVILNLCINAADAMSHRGTIRLTSRREDLPLGRAREHGVQPGPFAVLEVIDTGTGMAPRVLSRVFEPFFTTKGPQQGSGLGLVVVKSVVEDHGGFIEFDSTVGKGTTARLWLPLRPEPAAGASPTASDSALAR